MPDIIDYAVGTIIGNISTAVVLVLVYYNFLLFEDYFRVIIWSILFSQALRGAKENICRVLRYLSRGKEIERDVRVMWPIDILRNFHDELDYIYLCIFSTIHIYIHVYPNVRTTHIRDSCTAYAPKHYRTF